MPRTGRPRGFDRNLAVQQAMHLFWEQGYEATSLAQLKAAMGGIAPASFYAAFKSKEALFREVIDCYLATHGRVTAPLFDPAMPPRIAVEQSLRASVRMQTDGGHPLGCLIVLSTNTCSPESRHLQAVLATERQRNRIGLRTCLQRAIDTGELQRATDVSGMAAVFDAFLTGLSIEARDDISLPVLDAAITELMRLWDTHARSASKPQRAAGSAAGRG